MKQFILIKEYGVLQIGTVLNMGYDFADGYASNEDILSGVYGNSFEVLSLTELQERIQSADDELKEGF